MTELCLFLASDQVTHNAVTHQRACLRERLSTLDARLPTLYRQYVDLCEPEGVRFLDFGVDPSFGGCVDGLVRLDIGHLRAAKRARYLKQRALRG